MHVPFVKRISPIALLFVVLFFTLLAGDQSSVPDITNPGPDTPSFPTSPFTLPKGRCYIENFPVHVGLPNRSLGTTYNWPFLVRVGVGHFFELRMTSPGITVLAADCLQKKQKGFSPLALGFKTHLWGSQEKFWVPSGGLEMFLITPLASTPFKEGTQIIVNGLFEHTFPADWSLEWNLSLMSKPGKPWENRTWLAQIEWALQKEIVHNFALFFEGLYTTAKRPLYNKTFLLGVGFQSILLQRLSFYSSYVWSVYKTNQDFFNIGFAVAF